MRIFYLTHRYLGIVKSFQTLHVHMNNASRYGYKTGTFITKKIFFQIFYNFDICICMYICIYMLFLSEVVDFMAFELRFGFILSFFGRREVKNELIFLALAGENRGRISFSLK